MAINYDLTNTGPEVQQILNESAEHAAAIEQLQTGKEDAKALQDGMRMILTELDKAFRAEGITKMEVKGKPYNPDTQEVVAMIPAEKKQDGLVIDEVKMGFMMQDQVLRPASVVVGQAKEEN